MSTGKFPILDTKDSSLIANVKSRNGNFKKWERIKPSRYFRAMCNLTPFYPIIFNDKV